MACMVLALATVVWAGLVWVALLQVVPGRMLPFNELHKALLVQR